MIDNWGRDFVTVTLPLRLSLTELATLNEAAEAMPNGVRESTVQGGGRALLRARCSAEAQLRINRLRASVIGTDQFSDPSWNIMLDLFVRGVDGELTTVSSACIGADAPSTTALRHLALLVDADLVKREACERDHRVMYVSLTQDGHNRMLKLLS